MPVMKLIKSFHLFFLLTEQEEELESLRSDNEQVRDELTSTKQRLLAELDASHVQFLLYSLFYSCVKLIPNYNVCYITTCVMLVGCSIQLPYTLYGRLKGAFRGSTIIRLFHIGELFYANFFIILLLLHQSVHTVD